jgi:integrase
MMAVLRLRYVHSFVDKTGRVRFYFRYRGKRWPLPGAPGGAEFASRYDELRAECLAAATDRASDDVVVHGPGTVGFVVDRYLASEAYITRSESTRRHYRVTLDQLRDICGRALIGDLKERHIRQLRQRFAASSTADLAVMLLRTLWSFAKEELAMDLGPNPAAEIKQRHKRAWSHEPWPDDVIERFEAHATPTPSAQLALLLLLFTGQRASDVVRMRWNDYNGEGIAVRQLKTGAKLWIPCHSRLKEALKRTERKSEFILTTRYGKGYSAHGLCNMIADATARLGAKECTAHGLRCNAATALAEAGSSIHQIMAITGHQTLRQAQLYARHVEQRRLAQEAISRQEVANPRTKGQQTSG